MGKCIQKEISRSELERMRESGMTNQDIANSLEISVSTVYRYIGAQPPQLRRKYNRVVDTQNLQRNQNHDDHIEAALVVEDRSVGLAGLFAGYKIKVKSKEIVIFVEDGVDALIVPFDQINTFSKEINAICRHIEDLKIGNEMW